MGLKEFEKTCRDTLRSEGCAPILGLAPFTHNDIARMSEHMGAWLERAESKFKALLFLLDQLPAVVSVWLARKAGEAYEFGTFWERFEERIGVQVPPLRRPEFAERFCRSCWIATGRVVKPHEVGAFKHVEAFLFQAGLPLSHCDHFARLVRSAEQRYGLPEPDAPDAGEDLRDDVLTCFGQIAVPLLRRALLGPAGPLICHAALRVVLDGNYQGINPQLGKALEQAFTHQQGAQLRRAARLPFLRLGEDFCSLEVVGPRQDEKVAGGSGLTWLVEGIAYPTPSFDEFVFPVEKQRRLSVELRGLRGGLTASRSFVIDLADREPPFMLFDGMSRRMRRQEPGPIQALQAGEYYLLHPSHFQLEPATDQYPWLDGQRTLSLLRVSPEFDSKLDLAKQWVFKVAPNPFVQSDGRSLATEEGEQIHFGWTNLPSVWRPNADDVAHNDDWIAQATVGEIERSWVLSEGNLRGAMMECRIEGRSILQELRPGLHQIHISIFQGRRRQFSQSYWYWAGLETYLDGKGFRFSAAPHNLIQLECQGFKVDANSILHQHDGLRQHRLSFSVDGRGASFHWSRAGIFLESFEKKAAHLISPESRKLGETFSASIDSVRWLRVWHIPAARVDLLVNGTQLQQMFSDQRRQFIDVSLAQLSTLFPQGGTISLRTSNAEIPIARFTHPLVPLRIRKESAPSHRSLRLEFQDTVHWVRPRVHELASGKVIEFAGDDLGNSRHCAFEAEDLPPLECSLACSNGSVNPREGLSTLCLTLPKQDWPSGFWLVQLEVRRSESEDWQLLTTSDGRRVPLLVAGSLDPPDRSARFRLLSFAYMARNRSPLPPLEFVQLTASREEVFDLLSDVLRWIQCGFANEVADSFRWLEHLFAEMGRYAGKLLCDADGQYITNLLNLASRESDSLKSGVGFLEARSLFVTTPGLLALNADRYYEVSTTHPLAKALRWCGWLAVHDDAFQAFRGLIEVRYQNPQAPVPPTFAVLQLFRNLSQLVQADPTILAPGNLKQFCYDKYWTQIIGCVSDPPHQAEWDERIVLSRVHVEWAIGQLADRRQGTLNNTEFGAVNALLTSANSFRLWLRQALQVNSRIMPVSSWNHPWLSVHFPNDALMENCVRFASLFALAARAAGAGWLRFEDAVAWLLSQSSTQQSSEKAMATLVGMAPELFGYYLMFWELMIRTCPHE